MIPCTVVAVEGVPVVVFVGKDSRIRAERWVKSSWNGTGQEARILPSRVMTLDQEVEAVNGKRSCHT